MKICVLGAGVIGVASAFMLARAGHDVTVIDRASDIAQGASQANGAQLSYSHIAPLASPDTLKHLPGYLLGRDPSVQLRKFPNFQDMLWGLSFFANCGPKAFAENRNYRADLAAQSRRVLNDLNVQSGGKLWSHTGHGKLVLSRNKRAKSQSGAIDKARAQEIEPALKSWAGDYHSATFAPDDRALDTQIFARILRDRAQSLYKTRYILGTNVSGLELEAGRVRAVLTSRGKIDCDAAIVCLGNHAPAFLRPLGLRPKIMPLRGYSVTLPATSAAPKVSVTDLDRKMVYANLGDRIRIAGFLDWRSAHADPAPRITQLLSIAKQHWPDIADYSNVLDRWTGCRPTTPSGRPIISPTKYRGLYTNIGHGSLGYTFALGSAMEIARQINLTDRPGPVLNGETYAA